MRIPELFDKGRPVFSFEFFLPKAPEDMGRFKETVRELKRLEPELEQSKRRLQILLLPKDPNDDKNIMFEIRAGAGGDEAALFVGELFRLYQRYAGADQEPCRCPPQ